MSTYFFRILITFFISIFIMPAVVAQKKLESKPPENAITLFDGSRKMLDEKWTYWKGPRFAGTLPVKWMITNDPVEPGTVVNSHDTTAGKGEYGVADIVTKESFRDFRLHIEFLVAEKGGNSGVYLQNRYEIQIFDGDSTVHGMGAVINEAASVYAAYKGIGKWNTYDIMFRAARFEKGVRAEKARVTLYFNGIKVHDDQPIGKVWGGKNSGIDGGGPITDSPGGIKLQAEGHDVLFKNIWIKKLNIKRRNISF
jgi:hypothetical protein